MDTLSKLLIRCRVLYLGSVIIEDSEIVGFDSLQVPLSKRYNEPSSVNGVDARLLIYNNGIQVQFVRSPGKVIWFPICNLHVCAGVKCVTYVDGSSGHGSRKFIPVDSIGPELSECSPPIFGFITRARDASVCHVFICKSDHAALMLVQCCSSAYENRDIRNDLCLDDSVYLPPGGAFLADSERLASVFNVTSASLERNGTINSLLPSSMNWDTRSVATLSSGMRVVYAPQSVVNGGEEAIKNYFSTMQRSPAQYTTFQFIPSHREQENGHSKEENGDQDKAKVKGQMEVLKKTFFSSNPPPRSKTSSTDRRPVANGKIHSPKLEHRGLSPNPVKRSNPKQPFDTIDCTICNARIDIRSEIKNCMICNPRTADKSAKSGPKANRVKTNPIAKNDEGLPPIDYYTENFEMNLMPATSALPKLNDVVRKRADSLMDESVKDQVILRENRGRRQDYLGGRLANTHQNRTESAFARSIGEEYRSRPMVVGHGPSNVYEINGATGNRLFDNLQDTLGYYP